MPQVVGALAVTFAGWGAGLELSLFLAQATVRLLASVALGAIASNLADNARAKNLPAGIRTPETAAGGINPVSFITGTYATGGYAVCPPMSHGTSGKTPNAYLTYVIELTDIRGAAVSRIAIDGEWATLTGGVDADGFYGVTGRFLDHARVKFYDGSQVAADPWLLTTYGAYPERPWTSDMIGRDQVYAILVFKTNNDIWNGLPQVRFELTGIPLYDPRFDTTVGGSGAQRWANKATWVATSNPLVQAYNIFRGISLVDGSVWGGGVEAADLPLAEWFAAMNACDVSTSVLGGSPEPAYRSGFEVRGSDEPMMILEEIQKAASCKFVDVGGVWKPKVGAVGLPVMFITDDDLTVTKDQTLDPFPNLSDTYNGVSATYPEPVSIYEPSPAPVRLSSADELADGGRRLVADLSFSGVTSKDQVQRLMEAYRLDNRRFGSHALTLGPSAFILEPTDALSWTSVANDYTAEVFEIDSVTDDPMTVLQRVGMRKRDPADYAWTAATDTKPSSQASSKFVAPPTQNVPSWAVSAVSVTGDVVGVSRAAIRIAWDPVDLDSVTAIRYQVRRASDSVIITRASATDVDAGEYNIVDGLLDSTMYQVRGRLIITGVTTAWTAWTAVTTGVSTALTGTSGLVDNSVTNAKLADMVQATFKMRAAGAGTGAPIDGTATQAKTALAITQADVASLTSDLALKAPLASPTLTGNPTAPTPNFGDNDTSIATTAFVQELTAYGQLTADYTLTSVITAQKLFNFSTNGALTLATGRYAFRCMLYLTTMSAAAADNFRFRIDNGGTAVTANILYFVAGADQATALTTGTISGSASVSNLSESPVITGSANGEARAIIEGWFNITTSGTIIPGINLNTAAAAVVKAGSGIIVSYLGPTGSNTKGAWS